MGKELAVLNWQPILVIDTEANGCCGFQMGTLPYYTTLHGELIKVVNMVDVFSLLRVKHDVRGDSVESYGPSQNMLKDALERCPEQDDSIRPDRVYTFIKTIYRRSQIRETLRLIRRGVVKKAVFEIENYGFGTTFHFNSQYRYFFPSRVGMFDFSGCDVCILGKVEVRFDHLRFLDHCGKSGFSESEGFWVVSLASGEDGEMKEVASFTERWAAATFAIKIFREQELPEGQKHLYDKGVEMTNIIAGNFNVTGGLPCSFGGTMNKSEEG